MRIAYFGYDFFADVLRRLVDDGHNITHVFAWEFPEGDSYNSSREVIELADSVGAHSTLSRATSSDMARLHGEGCDLVLLAGYPAKVIPDDRIRAINLHPTLLPEGRGPFPLPWLVLHKPDFAGLTLHKVASEMDAGDILSQARISLDARSSLESLIARTRMTAPRLVAETVADLDRLWAAASPQGKGSYWKASAQDWELDWSKGVEWVTRQARAFGRLESVAVLDGTPWLVTMAEGWLDKHSFDPGAIVHRSDSDFVIAASDGFVFLRSPRLDPDWVGGSS